MSTPRPVVLVVGPALAGVTGIVDALAERIPGVDVLEAGDRAGDAQDWDVAAGVVVFAVSAVAPMTESDCERIDRAARSAPLIAAVTKVDAHRGWRDVLAADRAALAGRGPRYRDVPWVGVAASPDLGEPDVADLVAAVRRALPGTRPHTDARSHTDELRQRRVSRLMDRRRQVAGEHRREKSVTALAARSGVQQARVALTQWVRSGSARMSADLRAEAARLPRSGIASFEARVRAAAAEFAAQLEMRIDGEIAELAHALSVDPVPGPTGWRGADVTDPVWASRRVENQLAAVLGAGFGLGVALASGRLLNALGEGRDAMGWAAGALVGLAATLWVVGVRGLLGTRAVFDRWVVEVAAAARSRGETRIAARLLAAELALATASVERGEAAAARAADRIAAIDAEIRALTPRQPAQGKRPLPEIVPERSS